MRACIRGLSDCVLVLAAAALYAPAYGEVAEWLKALAWKACIRETVSRVRIPLSPPISCLGGRIFLAASPNGERTGKCIHECSVADESGTLAPHVNKKLLRFFDETQCALLA